MTTSTTRGTITLRRRLRYRFDNMMARGASGQFILLGTFSALIALVIVALTMLALAVFGGREGDTFWEVLTRTALLILVPDPVDFNEDGVLMFTSGVVALVGGLFAGGVLIGILTTAIEDQMDQLRRGRSFVAERHHTVILGWSSKVFRIIDELCIANEEIADRTRASRCIAILAPRDKVEMEEEIDHAIDDPRGTRVVCRSGTLVSTHDLGMVNLEAARSVILLSPEDRARPDSHIIQTLLTLAHVTRGRGERLPVIAEIRNRRNRGVCRTIGREAALDVVPVIFDDLIPRILAQAMRQRGLARFYAELFDFDGDELYVVPLSKLRPRRDLAGQTFRRAIDAFETSSVVGMVRDGAILLNPDPDTVCAADDLLIVIAEDDTAIVPSPGDASPPVDVELIVDGDGARDAPVEHNVILGWTRHVEDVICELDSYVASGSKLTVLTSHGGAEEEARSRCGALAHQRLRFHTADTGDQDLLESFPFEEFDNILVLPDHPGPGRPAEEVDAVTVRALVYLREIARRRDARLSITAQLLSKESSDVVETTRLGDFVVSDEIIGRIIAQVAEEPRLAAVFDLLLTPGGCEVAIYPAGEYVAPGKATTFHTVAEAAARRRQIAVGYTHGDSVVINPERSVRRAYDAADRVIVLRGSSRSQAPTGSCA